MKKNDMIDKIINIFFISVFTLLIFLKNVIGTNVNVIYITVLLFAFFIVSNKSVAVIIGFLIPFSSAIQGNYIIIIGLIIYLFKEKNKYSIDRSIFLILLIIIIELINCFNVYSTIKGFITFVITIVFTYIIINTKEKNNEEIIRYNILGIILASCIFLFQTFKSITFSDFILYNYRLGFAINSNIISNNFVLSFNSNELALYALFGISLVSFLRYKEKIKSYLYYAIIMYFTILGFLTMSRAFFIFFILFIITFIIKNKKRIISFVITLFFIIPLLAGIYNLNENFFDGIIINYQDRFSKNDMTNQRTTIIKNYNKVIFSTPKNIFIGSGTQNYNKKNNQLTTSHNATQEIFICWGIIGGIAYIFLIINYIKKSKQKNYKYDLNYYIPFIFLLFMVQTIPFLTQGIIIMLLYIALAPFGVIEQ